MVMQSNIGGKTRRRTYAERLKIWQAKMVEKVKDTCKGEIKGLWDVRKL